MKLKANAKINLTLDICGKRADGYHLIDSVMQSISLCDILSIEKAEVISVKCSDDTLCGDDNIASKAARAFFGFTEINGGADIYIEKHIPKAAGLGGGSADAAAVIVALDKIYETGLSVDDLCKIGLRVGADVPFCIVGGTARVGGIGEQIEKVSPMPKAHFVLSLAGEKQSTAQMYRMIDSAPQLNPYTDKMISAIENKDITAVAKVLSNAFGTVCDYSALKSDFEKTSPLGVSLSGSGPTVFAVYKNSKDADTAANQLESIGKTVYLAQNADCGIEIV